MLETISEPRADISPFAPRITQIKINPDKIGLLIGPGGKNIRAFRRRPAPRSTSRTTARSPSRRSTRRAPTTRLQRIKGMTDEIRIEVGEIYSGKIVGIQTYGAFVQLFRQGRSGPHLGALEDPSVRVNKVEDLFNLNDEITVMVTEVCAEREGQPFPSRGDNRRDAAAEEQRPRIRAGMAEIGDRAGRVEIGDRGRRWRP